MSSSVDEDARANFRRDVVEYLNLPEQIKVAEEPVRQMKTRFKELEKSIQGFMKTQDINQCIIPEEIGGGVLVMKSSTTKEPVKKENWERGINQFLKKRNIDATFDDVKELIDGEREYVTKSGLKRIKKK